MSRISSFFRYLGSSRLLSCLFSVAVVHIVIETHFLFWFKAVIKTGEHQVVIAAIMFSLFVFLFTLSRKLKNKSKWISFVVGLFFGYVSGMISVLVVSIFRYGGIDSMIKWFEHYGFYHGIGPYIVGGIITGSWLIGTVVFFIHYMIVQQDRRGKTRDTPRLL